MHTHTHAKLHMFGTDLHFSLRQFACLAFKWTCLTLHAYMMTNPTSNLLCLFAVRTNFFHLINDHALKATKCWGNHYTHWNTFRYSKWWVCVHLGRWVYCVCNCGFLWGHLCVYVLVCVFVMSKSRGNAVSTVTISLGGPSLIVCLVLMI